MKDGVCQSLSRSTVSALPEAGGVLAEYFDLRSEQDMLAKLERLIDDGSYRQTREAEIKQCFRPRDWTEIAEEITRQVKDRGDALQVLPTPEEEARAEIWPLPARIGHIYRLTRNSTTTLSSGVETGELYRMGRGWWSPDDWGTWLKRDVADLAFMTPEAKNHPYLMYLGVRGIPGKSVNYQASVVGCGVTESGILEPEETRWLVLAIEPATRQNITHIRMTTNGRCDLAEVTNRKDERVVTLGVLGFYLCDEGDISARDRFVERLCGKPWHHLTSGQVKEGLSIERETWRQP
jgi:hypothetical protein